LIFGEFEHSHRDKLGMRKGKVNQVEHTDTDATIRCSPSRLQGAYLVQAIGTVKSLVLP
jgi:hypothetical protein